MAPARLLPRLPLFWAALLLLPFAHPAAAAQVGDACSSSSGAASATGSALITETNQEDAVTAQLKASTPGSRGSTAGGDASAGTMALSSQWSFLLGLASLLLLSRS
ncbi:PLC-like phosphodiesterases superfamily protein [Zea mays]|uniref:PLC-like phosphodiesterases superfamily protein n=1 Tax=Zea mays TaxID=4577 RepID=A0A1D6QJW2_MAIZE|nr:PLC-like phosphodiesterases superfamily protein [Zea mays]